ncbi:DUF4124 domain-containing protein [Rudaea sp.]|uniref:DUF4124 domain-containing protein n=1 Tax=Rudaea sp. TaxID=2136325 RepID=UPI002ED4422C
MGKIALSLLLGSASAFVQAQTIYKCAGSNGSVIYSQSPCGKDARIVMQGRPASEKSSNGDEGGPPPSTRKPDANIQAISDSVDDSNCRRDAQRLAVAPSNEKIEQANRQIAELNSRVYVNGYGQTNTGNAAIANQQVEEEITSLRQVISSEQARNEALIAESKKRMADALAECDRKKSEREVRASK